LSKRKKLNVIPNVQHTGLEMDGVTQSATLMPAATMEVIVIAIALAETENLATVHLDVQTTGWATDTVTSIVLLKNAIMMVVTVLTASYR